MKLAPASEVAAISGHSLPLQGTVPSSHHRLGLTAVKDSTTKPAGTGGAAAVVDVVGTGDVVRVDLVGEGGGVLLAAAADEPGLFTTPTLRGRRDPPITLSSTTMATTTTADETAASPTRRQRN